MDIGSIYRREVFGVQATEALVEAARTMQANDVGALVVFLDDDLAGIITERDITRAMAGGVSPETTTVMEYMTHRPITITPETGVREAAAEMYELDVRHLPVTVDGAVVGMMSMRDLIQPVVDAIGL